MSRKSITNRLFRSGTSQLATVFQNEWFGPRLGPVIKVWTSGAWVVKPLKVRVSGSWVTKPVKIRAAGAWITLP